MDNLPIVGTVIGDPAGVGPEVCVKALATGQPQLVSRPLLVGDIGVLRRAADVCKAPVKFFLIEDVAALDRETGIPVMGRQAPGLDLPFGKISAAGATLSLDWLREARDLAERKAISAFIMAPFDSSALKLAGLSMESADFEPASTYQLRISGRLKVVPLTEHVPLKAAIDGVTQDRILQLADELTAQLKEWGVPQPHIGVAAINPHAMFDEDRSIVGAAVGAGNSRGLKLSGPISPDSIFRMALDGRFDAVITMYHDQGQIAVKTVGFEGACTVFLRLPYIRIGIPHGSALDIAGTGSANHATMLSGMLTAAALARHDMSSLLQSGADQAVPS
jgi:4-phospho-D-threonate 3-dehydrogenase / 4-phospho-D-erythronate 3-dehydrogenase